MSCIHRPIVTPLWPWVNLFLRTKKKRAATTAKIVPRIVNIKIKVTHPSRIAESCMQLEQLEDKKNKTVNQKRFSHLPHSRAICVRAGTWRSRASYWWFPLTFCRRSSPQTRTSRHDPRTVANGQHLRRQFLQLRNPWNGDRKGHEGLVSVT